MRHCIFLSAAFALVAISAAGVAQARAQNTLVIDIASTDPGEMLEISLAHGTTTTLFFPHGVDDAYLTSNAEHFEVDRTDKLVGIRPRPGAKRGNLILMTEKWQIGAAVVVVNNPADAVLQVEFRDIDAKVAVGKELLFRPMMTPVVQVAGGGHEHAAVRVGPGRALGDSFYAQLAIHNYGRAQLRIDLERVAVFTGAARVKDPRFMSMESAIEHADGRSVLIIEPGQVAQAMLILPEVDEERAIPLRVSVYDIDAQREIRTTVREWTPERKQGGAVSEQEARDLIMRYIGDAVPADYLPETRWDRGDQSLSIRTSFLAYGSDNGMLAVAVQNDGQFPFAFERIEVQDKHGTDCTAEVRKILPPGTEAVQVIAPSRNQVAGVVAPGATVRFAIAFEDAERLRNSGLQLSLIPPGGGAPVVANLAKRMINWQEPNKGRKSVLISGGGGVMQLERENDGSALTSAYGFGGQFVYGASGNLSFDIGVSRLVSGEADIAGIARSEQLYRLQGGLRYLFVTPPAKLADVKDGEWIPYARVGGGAALVSVQDGDDSSLDFRPFGQLSIGISRLVVDTLVIGADASVEVPAGGGGSSGMVNLYLGLAWGGSEF